MTPAIHSPQGTRGHRSRQRGSVLAVGLLFLLMITLLTMIGTMQAKTGARLAGNSYDRYLAFQAAEAALREAEYILSGASLPVFDGTDGLYVTADGGVPSPFELDAANSIENCKDIDGASQRPRYIIEQYAVTVEVGSSLLLGTRYSNSERIVYRISALGFGRSTSTAIALQTTYKR